MKLRKSAGRLAAGLVFLLVLAACNDDDDEFGVGPGSTLVGGACEDSADCQERCVRGGDWPGGMCTVSCRDDGDCPEGTACIEDEGGICALRCDGGAECSDAFGNEWACRSRDREGHSGSISVCRGD